MNFDEKVTRADMVVLGEVVRSSSRFAGDGRWIVTDTTLNVTRSFKGAAASEVVVTTPGGSVGGLHQQTVGVPRLKEGTEKVVFLKQRNDGGSSIVGLAQGTYDVRVAADGSRVIQPVTSDLILLDQKSGMVVPAEEKVRTLDEFERLVRAAGSRRPMIQAASSVRAKLTDAPPMPNPFADFVEQNKFVLTLLAIGAILSTIPFLIKRR